MYITIDLGGTKTLVALVNQNKEVTNQIRFETPKNYSEFKDALVQAKSQFPEQNDFEVGAIGTRGIIDRESGLMVTDNVLPWENAPLVSDCEEVFGCKFLIENDSKLAGLSEAREYTGKHSKILYITISTGIGSALIVDGKLEESVEDSEIGKWLFEHDGKIKTWQDFASGHWITETYGMRASELNDETAWVQISKNLAIGFVDAVAAYNPELIIVGGGVGTHFDKFGDKLISEMKNIIPEGLDMPEVVKAKYPEEAVIYGCYELIKG